jgi:hypothetical protein
MLHPSFELSEKIYNKVIAPFMMGHEKTIDKKLEEIAIKGKDKFDELEKRAKN